MQSTLPASNRTFLSELPLLYCCCLLLAFLIFTSPDHLLFQSGVYNVFLITNCIGIVFLALFGVIFLSFSLFRINILINKSLDTLFIILVFSGFFCFFFDSLASLLYKFVKQLNFNLIFFRPYRNSILTYFIPGIFLFFFIFYLKFVIKSVKIDEDISFKIKTASRFFSLLSIVLLFIHIFQKDFSSNSQGKKNLILIVLDAFPSQILNCYSNQEPSSSFDNLCKKGQVFKAYTNQVFTAGFFRVLYTGKYWQKEQNWDISTSRSRNLLKLLQEKGVQVLLNLSHINAFPDTCQASDYSGIRSLLLTPKFRNFMNFLGLSPHFIVGQNDIGIFCPRLNGIYKMFCLSSEEEFWKDDLTSEIHDLNARSKPYFLLIHSFFNGPQLASPTATGEEITAVAQQCLKNEGYVGEEYAFSIQKMLKDAQKRKDIWAERLVRLLRVLQENQSDETLIIVTADHGCAYGNGKWGYGYHYEEEVTRVPFIVFGKGLQATHLSIDTFDLRATILDYFHVEPPIVPTRGRSLIRKIAEKPIYVFSKPGNEKKEQYAVLYNEKEKKVMNIFPSGKKESWSSQVIEFDEGKQNSKFPQKSLLLKEFEAELAFPGID